MHSAGSSTPVRGFTLIELLVVIAIIGILSSVVLASLNTARNKGADAATKSSLNSMRAQSEIFYDNQTPNTYDGFCTHASTTPMLTSARNSAGVATINTTDATAQAATNVTCHDDATGWAASAPLKSGSYWCTDSTGTSSVKAVGVAASQYRCS